MRHFFNEFFYYTATERAGILGLLFLCIMLASGSCWLPWLLRKPATEVVPLPVFPAAWAATAGADTIRPAAVVGRLDVNAPDYASLQALGLPPASIRAWMGYVKKGGRFRRPADLARFRGLTAADRERIMPQLVFPEENERRPAAVQQPAATPAPVLFAFDPNTATVAELRQLGLSERLANNLQRYRDKGGRFRKAEDLQRLYGLAPADYERLRPFVQIPGGVEKNVPPSPPPPVFLLDVNTADAAAWEQLRGIGPALSRRILGFRDRLGGFSSLAQIAETYGLPDSTYQRLLPQLQWSPVYRPLLVNVYGAEELSRHPYLDKRSAAAIIHYRNQHGSFRQPEELRLVMALDKTTVDKLIPYISCAAQADE